MTNLLEQTKAERIEEIMRHRTASFTLASIAEWISEQGLNVSAEDVLPVASELYMKGVIRRESKTEWTVI